MVGFQTSGNSTPVSDRCVDPMLRLRGVRLRRLRVEPGPVERSLRLAHHLGLHSRPRTLDNSFNRHKSKRIISLSSASSAATSSVRTSSNKSSIAGRSRFSIVVHTAIISCRSGSSSALPVNQRTCSLAVRREHAHWCRSDPPHSRLGDPLRTSLANSAVPSHLPATPPHRRPGRQPQKRQRPEATNHGAFSSATTNGDGSPVGS